MLRINTNVKDNITVQYLIRDIWRSAFLSSIKSGGTRWMTFLRLPSLIRDSQSGLDSKLETLQMTKQDFRALVKETFKRCLSDTNPILDAEFDRTKLQNITSLSCPCQTKIFSIIFYFDWWVRNDAKHQGRYLPKEKQKSLDTEYKKV